MNREDVIRLAKEAGVFVRGPYDDETGLTPQELERFANLVEAQQSDRYKAMAGELAEALVGMVVQHSCYCGHPHCNRCAETRECKAALAKYKQEKLR
jgi:hypothetical protein